MNAEDEGPAVRWRAGLKQSGQAGRRREALRARQRTKITMVIRDPHVQRSRTQFRDFGRRTRAARDNPPPLPVENRDGRSGGAEYGSSWVRDKIVGV